MIKRSLALLLAAVVAAVAVHAVAARPAARVSHRIVSLSPTATEMLFAVGGGKQVVAVDNQSNIPASAPRTSLSGLTSSPEAIAAYRPDLVVLQFDPGGLVSGLEKLGIRTLVQPAARSLDESYEQIRQLGSATGHLAKAKSVVGWMRSRISALYRSAGVQTRQLSVYYELDDTYYSATSNTFIGQILAALGLRNIADAADKSGSGYPQLSAEYIVSSSPDVIILADSNCCKQSAETVAARPGWSTIAAVRRGGVFSVDDDLASRWGPRTVALVRIIAARMKALRGQ